jgi:S-adenosylmethionine:tRNA ribosyltransferase-isomerase
MRVERFAYDLPSDLIAQEPAAEREKARLLVVGGAEVRHDTIAELTAHIEPGSLVVVNDTKVLRARVLGIKEGSGGKAELFLLRREAAESHLIERWQAMARASKPLRIGARVISGPLVAEIEGKTADGTVLLRLTTQDTTISVEEALGRVAHVPLPPYIRRTPRPEDADRYQTVFARVPGAVAAPTAGLHLTQRLFQGLVEQGCEVVSCTLHVGLGTFQPVTTPDLDDHVMHAERFEVSDELVSAVARARKRAAPVVAIGTTVVRALESAADVDHMGLVRPCAEETRILIQPGYRFRVVDRLLTNFHLPCSTLLALVCAFAGTDRTLAAYRVAVQERYRFFSYGDAMLLTRAKLGDSP